MLTPGFRLNEPLPRGGGIYSLIVEDVDQAEQGGEDAGNDENNGSNE